MVRVRFSWFDAEAGHLQGFWTYVVLGVAICAAGKEVREDPDECVGHLVFCAGELLMR